MNELQGGSSVWSGWGERCLAVTRGAAIAAVGAVPFSTALTSIACAVMVASWAVSGQVLTTLSASLRQPFGAALLLFLLIAAAGMFHSSAPWPMRLDTLSGWRRFGYALILLGIFSSDAWRQRFIAVFLAVASIGVVMSFLSWLQIIGSKSEYPGIVLHNHATQSIVFSLAILCAAHYTRNASTRTRCVLIAMMVVFAGDVLFVTPSRSGYLSVGVASISTAGMLYGWRRTPVWLPVILLAAVLAFATSPLLRDRIAQGWNEFTGGGASAALTSMGTRAVFYSTTIELIRERPVFGHGTGSFGTEYGARVAGRYTDWRATPSTDPHNQYLYIAMEHGIVGLAAFIAVLIAGFLAARASPYGWIGGTALAIWCLTSVFNSHFRTFPEGHLIGLFLGAMLAAAPGAPGSPARSG